jgi:hypothetical protein
MWIQTFQTSLACRNNHRNGVRENSSQQNSQKQYLLRFFLEIFGYKTFVKIYLILPEILSVINSRILKSEGGYWVPTTLVEQSKTRNEHGPGTQIGYATCKSIIRFTSKPEPKCTRQKPASVVMQIYLYCLKRRSHPLYLRALN